MQEYKNAEKQLTNAEEEYGKLNARFEQVTNPQYILQLKEIILSYEAKIKKMGKNRKKLENDQFHREKQMQKVIQTGEFDIAQNINAAHTDRLIVESKLEENDGVLSKNAAILEDQQKRLADIKSQIQKQTAETTKLGIDLNHVKKPKNSAEQEESIKKFKQKKELLKKDINLIKARKNVSQGDFNQKRISLQKQLENAIESIEKKNSIWNSHLKEFTDLISKLKGVGNDILDSAVKRWESLSSYKKQDIRNIIKTRGSQKQYDRY